MQHVIFKAKRSEWGWMGKRTKIITEYRQTGWDADGDEDGVGEDGVGMGTMVMRMGREWE